MLLFPVVCQSWIYVSRARAAGSHLRLEFYWKVWLDIFRLLHGVFGVHLVRCAVGLGDEF